MLRNSSNRRCNCTIGSGISDVPLLFNISRPQRLIELSNLTHKASRTLAENSQINQ
uniref:Uncharacterized protein n=1 Tax=mine drainage metagenome TaxID=410659 RepID=E6QLL7_9ZZZZ